MSTAFSSCVPCDMLMRTPFAPAAISFSTISGSREAGPSVIRIFAFLKVETRQDDIKELVFSLQSRQRCRDMRPCRIRSRQNVARAGPGDRRRMFVESRPGPQAGKLRALRPVARADTEYRILWRKPALAVRRLVHLR